MATLGQYYKWARLVRQNIMKVTRTYESGPMMNDAACKKDGDHDYMGVVEELVESMAERLEGENDDQSQDAISLQFSSVRPFIQA